MPLTLTLTEDVLPAGREKIAFTRLCEAMLRWHGLVGNRVMTPNVVGTVQVLPKGSTFSGMEETPVVFVEWKVPSFAFADRQIQEGYFEEATAIIHDLSGGKQPRDRIFINVVHAVDGAWNFNGRAATNQQIGAAAAVAYPPLERKLLLDQPLPETTIRAVKSARIEFAGGQPSGAHLHPGPVFGIVTRGSFIFQVHDRPVRTLHAGDAFYEPANLPIDRFDNASPDQPAEIEAFYLLGSAEQALVQMLPQ